MFESVQHNGSKEMLKGIHALLDEADVVVHYNGKRFDVPTLNKEFLMHGMPPPAPYKQVDLLQVTRNKFRFTSNKLDYVSGALGLGNKTKHAGYQLWVDCMANKASAWKQMKKYNIQDVKLLESLYDRLLPWIGNHPNRTLYDGAGCPRCGSSKYQSRGVARSNNLVYNRFQCVSCGGWFRNNKRVSGGKTEHKIIG